MPLVKPGNDSVYNVEMTYVVNNSPSKRATAYKVGKIGFLFIYYNQPNLPIRTSWTELWSMPAGFKPGHGTYGRAFNANVLVYVGDHIEANLEAPDSEAGHGIVFSCAFPLQD